jgi:RND family efflux transporter MFP subunit
VPRNTGIGTLASLEAAVTRHAAELETRRARLERLQKLLAIEAVSQREVEEVRTEVVSLEADLDAAQRDLANERSARRGGRAGDAGMESRARAITIEAPFTARVAMVHVSPGETVAAGASLARLVVPAPLWVEVRLPPAEAMRFDAAPSGMLLRTADGTEIEIASDDVELVARYPEVEATTGTVGVVFALQKPPDALIPGLRAEAELLLPTAREGIVIPRDSLVDDSGIDVVYVQQDGESFARREVTILARQGERILVAGLHAGERLVVRGGPTLRRASLMANGGGDHGHVH